MAQPKLVLQIGTGHSFQKLGVKILLVAGFLLILAPKKDLDYLEQHIESLIFTGETPVSVKDIRQCLSEVFSQSFNDQIILEAIEQLKIKYEDERFAMEIVEIDHGFQFLTKGAYHRTVGQLLKINSNKKLSRAALETISIIAYRQPVSKSDIEKVRGVSCDYTIQKLLEKELVSIVGRSDGPGRPLLYGTSTKFMDYFGLKGVSDLPKLKEFKMPESEIGEQAPIEESSPPQEDHDNQG